MLCSALLDAPALRDGILRFLASLTDTPLPPEGLRWQIDTELPIGGKRDDLRIEGFTGEDPQSRLVLWTMEIKVGAGFHKSFLQQFS